MPSFREELIEILSDPIEFDIFNDPILWDGQTFSASGVDGMIHLARQKKTPTIKNPLTGMLQELKVGKDSAKKYFPENKIVASIVGEFGGLLDASPTSPEESRKLDKYLSQTLYVRITATKEKYPQEKYPELFKKLFENNIIVKQLEEACKAEFRQQREEFSKKHAVGRQYLENQEKTLRAQLEDARKNAKEEVVRRQLAREELLARARPAWGASPVGARNARKDSFSSSSDSSSPGTSTDSQRFGRPLHSFPVPSGTASRPLTPGIDKRGAPQRLVPIDRDSRLLQVTPAQKAHRERSLQRRAWIKEQDEQNRKRSSSVGSGDVLRNRQNKHH